MIAILIVNWNVRELLRACLQSLRAHPATTRAQEIFVVDNASSDGSVEMLRANFPEVHLIANATNRGFTGGNNDGLREIGDEPISNLPHRDVPQSQISESPFDYVLLLNPDTEVTAGALDALLAYADAHTDVAVVGPQLRYADGSLQSSRRRFPTLATALLESTWLQKYAPKSIHRCYHADDLPIDQPCDVDWVVGAAMLARGQAVKQVGGFDEQFFMYSEEVDWCKRMKDAGWRVVWLPAATIIHHEGKSSDQVSTRRMIHFNTSKVRYLRKHHGAVQATLARWGLLALLRWEWLIEGVKRALGHRPALRAERMQAYSDVIRTGLK